MYIEQFLNSGRVASQMDAVLDDSFAFLVDPDKETYLQRVGKKPDPKILSQYALMDEFCPLRFSDDPDVLSYLVERNLAIASVIAPGGEVVTTSAGKILRMEGDFFKLTIGHTWDEKTQEQMIKFRKMLPGSTSQTFIDMLFGTVEDLQPRIIKLANVLTWQCITTGQVNYTDPRSGAIASLSYNITPENFPAPLTGTAAWTDYTNARGIEDLENHAIAYYNRNGFYPDRVVMSLQLRTHLLRQNSTRDRALTMGLVTNVPGINSPSAVSPTILEKMITEIIPGAQLTIYDAQYEIELSPGNTARGRYLNSNYYAFLVANIGERLFGATVENEGKAGMYVKTEELKSSPPQDRSYAVGKMIPFFPRPQLLGARKVV